ncbi:MAG TPA: hypothetical protein VK186_27850, partial [Candidatus Deferrimicrobium sp.]|nr:hypothetical protein [Candidatus Deferrimicrobium sp.]
FKEMRAANKKNTHRFKYYYLTLQESWYHKQESVSKNRFFQKLQGNFKNIPVYPWGTVLQFGKCSNAGRYKQTGWSPPGIYGSWTNGKAARLLIPLPRTKADSIILQVNLKAFLGRGKLELQRVNVVVNGHETCNWQIREPGYNRQTAIIPRRFIKKNRAEIEFLLPDAVSPAEVGFNNDERILGIHVKSVELTPNISANHENQTVRE